MRYIILFATLIFSACNQATNSTSPDASKDSLNKNNPPVTAQPSERLDVQPVFDKYNVKKGFFVLMDATNGQARMFNSELATEAYSPMSTFKIPNTLIALESGAVKSPTEVIKWNGKKGWMPDWNRDHDLRSAFKYSVFPFYQEVARRAGKAKMQDYLNKFDYGNKVIGNFIDSFWIDGSLKINAAQQIGFLRKVHEGNLPVSKEALAVLKDAMVASKDDTYILRSKTGTGEIAKGEFIGWYVGYVENGKDTYYFASAVFGDNPASVRKKRLQIAEEILREKCSLPSLKAPL